MTTDLADLEEDRRIFQAKTDPTPSTFVSAECPCPMPEECRWKGRTCETCGRKAHPHPSTLLLLDLAKMLEGGMTIASDELSKDQWVVLGDLRAARRHSLGGG